MRISHGASRAFWVNVTLRTRAIVYPLWIPSSLSLLGFACSDRVFGNLLCKSAALPPQKLQLLAKGEFMLHLAKLRRGLAPLRRMTRGLRILYLLRSLSICEANGAVQATRQNFICFAARRSWLRMTRSRRMARSRCAFFCARPYKMQNFEKICATMRKVEYFPQKKRRSLIKKCSKAFTFL